MDLSKFTLTLKWFSILTILFKSVLTVTVTADLSESALNAIATRFILVLHEVIDKKIEEMLPALATKAELSAIQEDLQANKIANDVPVDGQGGRFKSAPVDEEPSAKGQECQAMSSNEGVCTLLDECFMHEDVTSALKNNATPPYYFEFVHDKMACGFINGPQTLICCESSPLEIPPSVNMLVPPECGVQSTSTTRVVGGKPVTEPGTYPWLASIGYNSTAGEFSWQCGGALISRMHVLTAAHCAHPVGLIMHKVRLGALTLDTSNPGSSFWQEHYVRFIRDHREYNSKTKKNDIAIVVLADKVVFTQFVHPICLPYQTELKAETFEKKRPFVAGWGRISYDGATSERLLQVQMIVRNNVECQAIFKKWNRQITPKHMCAGDADGIHDTCRGDSGSPLMQPIGNYYYVIGLVSYGYYCAVRGYPSVNVRITEYIDWISQNMYDD